jgi:hypothetical protein
MGKVFLVDSTDGTQASNENFFKRYSKWRLKHPLKNFA